MALAPGSVVGPYEVLTLAGAGGMGEVYRVRDSRLGRDVALRSLPERFALDADRLARFRREAQLLASLNHPNIATIHGIEEAGGQLVLVLELVDGVRLSDRQGCGSLPPDNGCGEQRLPLTHQLDRLVNGENRVERR